MRETLELIDQIGEAGYRMGLLGILNDNEKGPVDILLDRAVSRKIFTEVLPNKSLRHGGQVHKMLALLIAKGEDSIVTYKELQEYLGVQKIPSIRQAIARVKRLLEEEDSAFEVIYVVSKGAYIRKKSS